MYKIINFLKRNKALNLQILICLTIQVVCTLLVPYLIADLIDFGILGMNNSVINSLTFQMLVVAIVGTVGSILGCYLCSKISANFGRDLRNQYFKKIQELSVKDTDEFGLESLLARMTSDIDNIQLTIVMTLQMVIPAPLIIIASIVMTFYISPIMAIIPIIVFVVFMFYMWRLIKKGIPASLSIQSKLDKMLVSLREFFIGIRVIKAFDNQSYEEQRNLDNFENYKRSSVKVNTIFATLTPVSYLFMGMAQATILLVGAYLFNLANFPVGQITSVTEYIVMAIQYLVYATTTIVTIPKAIISMKRIDDVLNKTPQITEVKNNGVMNEHDKILEVTNLSFSYDVNAKPVINDISFSLQAGDLVAIVGGTGSGKSTITRLLLRFVESTKGSIKLYGTNIKDLTLKQLRDSISYVPQKAFLFNGTIETNLRIGSGKSASVNDMEKALVNAQAFDFVSKLEDGLQSFVAQGGTNFSGGQRQRLSIARALSKKAPIYIFDDSFSALDYKTENELKRAIKTEYATSAKLIITQRLSTIKDCNKIIVLNEGKIVGVGKHDELLKNNTVYQEFAISQNIEVEEGENA